MKRLAYALVLICLAGSVRAAIEYREFTSADGKTIRGRIISYDANKEIVTIERESKRRASVPVTVFSEADQAYIEAWKQAQVFLSSKFKVTLNKRRRSNESLSSRGTVSIKAEDTYYEVFISNRSATPLYDITIKYCIYYEQEDPNRKQGVHCGELKLDSISSTEEKELKTDPVTVYKSDLDSGYYYTGGHDSSQNGSVHGIWIKVMMNTGAEVLVKEICLPDSIPNSRSWATKTRAVGVN